MGAEINITTDEKYKTECDDKNMYGHLSCSVWSL